MHHLLLLSKILGLIADVDVILKFNLRGPAPKLKYNNEYLSTL